MSDAASGGGGEACDVTVYFNPSCSKCRATMAILDEQHVSAEVVEYLVEAPDREELERLMGLLGMVDPRQVMRTGEPRYAELDLGGATRDELLDALAANPVLLQRPIVVRGDRAVIARPPERVTELLDRG